MSGPLKLGWRNIWRNRRRTFISMSAIGVGLLLVIFYSGMMGGVLGDAKNQLDVGGVGHVEVTAPGYRARHDAALTIEDPGALPVPAGSDVGTRVLARGLATSARGNEPVQIFGVDWKTEKTLSAHLNDLRAGALPEEGDDRGVLIGQQLADRLGLKVGNKLRLMVSRVDGEMGADLFRVRGIFHSISPAIGQRQVYVSQPAVRTLIGLEHGIHQIVVQVDRADQAEAVAQALQAKLGDGYEVKTWGQLMPVLKRMDELSNNVVFAMAAFVYLLVGLGVLNTMLMSVLERTREFGVLMALGTRPQRIVGVVLAESFWISTLSVLLGAALGALLTWKFSTGGFHLAGNAESFQLSGATMSAVVKTRFSLADIVKASSFVYLMALVVGLYPASRITRLPPAEALRRT